MNTPRVVISATTSDAGKTLITSAIVRILRKRGFKVQTFKVGPDYIDPMYLSRAAERPCRNLDSWLMSEDTVKYAFMSGSEGVDLALIEGVRGLYEGESPTEDYGSTAHIAKILSAPVILVVDCKSLTRSVAAQIIGYQAMDGEVNIAGVLLNNVKDASHEEKLRRAIQHYTNVPVIGLLYRSPDFHLKKRHLGLVTPHELSNVDKVLNNAAEALERSLDIDRLIDIMKTCSEIDVDLKDDLLPRRESKGRKLKVGVFMDAPFSFYYYDNLLMLRRAGAEISVIDSLSSRDLDDDLSGILIGGGYPEIFASELEKNSSLRQSLKEVISDGMPVIGECGGLMYLCRSINYSGRSYEMVGVFDGDVYFDDKPRALSYVELRAKLETPISDPGNVLRGHEFHYSYIENLSCEFAFDVLRGKGIRDRMDGATVHRTVGTYTHLHYLARPDVPIKFLSACEKYANR
ncbi:MAG: hydrogenobyrinic acid a,c-diamide synthase (glutamine-hydrolyzing) [Candidatus Korarchaeum sp.]|nr:hydrogenobyrinic acid a,c-diamide synthase (glutamine-hydrolyzing) [Candidatus Korarchaeum sp.]MDW8035085.1 cobyrinate a,c-diamide synthase [Candidatus Korarchaeum sp.]